MVELSVEVPLPSKEISQKKESAPSYMTIPAGGQLYSSPYVENCDYAQRPLLSKRIPVSPEKPEEPPYTIITNGRRYWYVEIVGPLGSPDPSKYKTTAGMSDDEIEHMAALWIEEEVKAEEFKQDTELYTGKKYYTPQLLRTKASHKVSHILR